MTDTTTLPPGNWTQELWDDLHNWEQDIVSGLHEVGVIFESDIWPALKAFLLIIAQQDAQAAIKALVASAASPSAIPAAVGAAVIASTMANTPADALNMISLAQAALAGDPNATAL